MEAIEREPLARGEAMARVIRAALSKFASRAPLIQDRLTRLARALVERREGPRPPLGAAVPAALLACLEFATRGDGAVAPLAGLAAQTDLFALAGLLLSHALTGPAARPHALFLSLLIHIELDALDDLAIRLADRQLGARCRARLGLIQRELTAAARLHLLDHVPDLRDLPRGGSPASANANFPTLPLATAIHADADAAGEGGFAAPMMSLIVVSRRRPFQLFRLLASIAAMADKAALGEVIVLLNGASERAAEALIRAFPALPGLRVIARDTELPIGAARNVCIEQARWPLVLSLDADMVALGPLALLARAYSAAGLGAAELFMNLGYIEAGELEQAKHVKSFEVTSSAPPGSDGASRFIRNTSALRLSPDSLGAGQIVASNRLGGGAALIPKHRFVELGGFSTAMDIGWEDLEFSIRLVRSGRLVLNSLDLPLFHGHLMPFLRSDVQAEKWRFAKERLRPSLEAIAKQGFRIHRRADRAAGTARLGSAGQRQAMSKFRLFERFETKLFADDFQGPAVGLVVTGGDLYESTTLRRLLRLAPPSWRFVPLFATEVRTFERLAPNLFGVNLVIISQRAVGYLGRRPDPWRASFADLARRFTPLVRIAATEEPGPDMRVAARSLAELFPAADVAVSKPSALHALIVQVAQAIQARKQGALDPAFSSPSRESGRAS